MENNSSNTVDTKNDTIDQAERLANAGKKAVAESVAHRERTVKGSHLTAQLLEIAKGRTIEEKSGFQRIAGSNPKRGVYVAKKGGRVDLSGFTVDHPVVTQISEKEARDRHLGRVRGTFNFENADEAVLEAFAQALAASDVADPEVSKEPKAPKEKKEKKEKPAVEETATPPAPAAEEKEEESADEADADEESDEDSEDGDDDALNEAAEE